jgi:hypothetical protein
LTPKGKDLKSELLATEDQSDNDQEGDENSVPSQEAISAVIPNLKCRKLIFTE